jgi:hypothetical protein
VLIKSQKDFWSGLMFIAVGGGFAIGAQNYTVGTSARMGPGYFPMLVGILLAVLGAIILFKSLTVETPDGDKIGKWAWRPLFFVIAANLAFGALLVGIPSWGIPHMGMVVAIIAMTYIAALGGDEFNFKEVTILAIILAVGSYVAFVWGLNLQFPVWPSFIAG